MAACADAAARSSRTYSCVFVLLTGLSLLSHALSHRLRYEQVELLKIGNRCQDYTIGNPNSIPLEILQPKRLSGSGAIITPPVRLRRRRRERKQKRGKRTGVRARLQANPSQTFFSNLINRNLNTCTLFATVERLTNPLSQIPSEMLSDSKCNEFASFFSEKISNIRKEIGTSSCNTEVTQIRQQSQKEVTMSVFKTIDSKILEEIVQHLKSSTCYLDTLPTSFFQKCA